MRALIVSLGSIGRRHLANLRQVEPAAQIVVWRQHARRAEGGSEASPAAMVYSLPEALAFAPEVAVIASPASGHVETARALAEAGVHLLVEKPLSDRMEGVDGLLETCHRKGVVLAVGYHLRFSNSLQRVKQALHEGAIGRLMTIRAEVGQYLPEWRGDRDYREGVSARRELGGGVVLELSHELDYVRWLGGEVKSVMAQTGRLSDLEVDVEDTAEILLRFVSGAVGSVHLDMAQRSPTRKCRLVGTEGTVDWDGLNNEVRLFSGPKKSWQELYPAGKIDRNELYLAELRHFLRCAHGLEEPAVSGAEGRRVLQLALAARESSDTQRSINL